MIDIYQEALRVARQYRRARWITAAIENESAGIGIRYDAWGETPPYPELFSEDELYDGVEFAAIYMIDVAGHRVYKHVTAEYGAVWRMIPRDSVQHAVRRME